VTKLSANVFKAVPSNSVPCDFSSRKREVVRLDLRTPGAILCVLVLLVVTATGADDRAASDIDVGGYRLHTLIAGTGTPGVVFEDGLGEPLDTWKSVQPAIAKLTTTVSYDRGGLGQSQPAPGSGPRSRRDLADELHRLLQAAKIPGPYILVGHSLGGSVVQVFASAYPDATAGLVLVDPEDSRLTNLLKAKLAPDVWAAREKILSTDTLPLPIKREFDGMNAVGEKTIPSPLPPVPVVLLTGTQKNPDFPGNPIEQDLKLDLHNELAANNPKVEHVLVAESRHYIQDDAPEKVIAAIERVLTKIRVAAKTAKP
jgi:pimeloyl-ACP methyl ester carboxylesterase